MLDYDYAKLPDGEIIKPLEKSIPPTINAMNFEVLHSLKFTLIHDAENDGEHSS